MPASGGQHIDWLLTAELVPLCVECLVYQLSELSVWVWPATWDKGECQCHPAPPCDSRDRDVWRGSALEPLSMDLELL